jgi:tetratricopeptide (TPR) repeat protein
VSREELDALLQEAERSLAAAEPAQAGQVARRALECMPGNPDALRLLGTSLLLGERAEEAIPLLREALQAAPRDLRTLDALSAAYMTVEDPAQAEEIVRRALALDADLPVAHMRLGLALARQSRWSEAAEAYRTVTRLDPSIAEAHHNLGDACSKLYRFADAVGAFRRAVALDPGKAVTHNMLGIALHELRLWEGAGARYERAKALDPALEQASYNLGLLRVFLHEFEHAWQEYERRLKVELIRRGIRADTASVALYEALPRWRGPDDAVPEVAVWSEQGIGDQIIFSTLLPDLIEVGIPFRYEVDARLLPAYQRAFPRVRFVPLEDPPREVLQRADRVFLAGSLPGLFRTTRESFARQPARLLAALPERVAHYRKRLAALGSGLKVAFSWRSTRQDWMGAGKSAQLADLAATLTLPGAHFVDVQYGDTAAERSAFETAHGLRLTHFDDVDCYNDLEEVLAILEACDLVVTTSNATAHFAGALGKRTWLLYLEDRAPFYYWSHRGSHRCLWYPSVEIVTGLEYRDWPLLARAVAVKLATEMGVPVAAEGAGDVDGPLANAREWFDLGGAQWDQGKMTAAIASYRKALEVDPGYAEAWSNLGGALGAGGDNAGEIEAYLHAISVNPRLAPVWSNLGNALLEAGDVDEAISACRRAVEVDANHAQAHFNLGVTLRHAGRGEEALACFRRTLELEPGHAPARELLAAPVTGDHAQAEAAARQALAVRPDLPHAHLRLGLALANQGKLADSVPAFAEAARLAPHAAEAHFNLGDALIRLRRFPEAVAALRHALAVTPADASAHNFLGVALQELRLWEGAIARYERAAALDPSYAMARYNLGVARLYRREFERAWDDYERWLECPPLRAGARKDTASLALYEALPRWRGPQEPGVRSVAIWADQGIGDQILHSTLLPELVETGVPFHYEVDARLLPAYRRAFPQARFVALADPPGEALRRTDRVLLAGSLPAFFRRSVASFERQPPRVLVAAPERVAHYRQTLGVLGPGIKVALSWRSTRTDWLGADKNAPLADLAPLLRSPGAHFVDVQYGETAAERRAVEGATGVRLAHFDGVDYHDDLEEVLAILEACDLVVTTSNATAHLAGALGKRTWLLYPSKHAPFHYWIRGAAERSLWYPAVEVVTDVHLADWPSLARAAAVKLAAETGMPVAADGAGEADGPLANAREWFNLGGVQWDQGEMTAAIASYRKALEVDPGYTEAWSNLGGALGAAGDKAGEIEAYLRAISINQRLAPVWSNLGSALLEAGDVDEALSACRRALEVDPGFAAAWNNLGSALVAKGAHEEAVKACESALALVPEFAEARGTLGAALHGLGRHEEALSAHRRALAGNPGNARLHFNFGVTLQHCGRSDEAIAAFRRALEIDPHHAQTHWDLSFALLATGRFEEGWAEYEWRWRRPGAEARRHDFAPWAGDTSRPLRLLLWGEQGVGDQILYAGMIPELLASPLRATLEVDARLVSLFQRSFPGAAVVPQGAPADPAAYDAQVPLGSLGGRLRSSFESFPRHAGYLKPDAARTQAYRRRLLTGLPPDTRLVGVSWRSANREFGAHKSSALRDWIELLGVPGLRFIDLQYGDTTAERAAVAREAGVQLEHLSDLDLFNDLEGLAALVAACDFVITVSNVTAHVAGALGHPVWLLVPEGNGRLWYWFQDRADSPWYPSMRIHTRRHAQGWSDLLGEVARELAAS